MAVTTTIPIRGYHCDAYGHVNNARYMELLEEARWAYIDQEPAVMRWCEANGVLFVVASAKLDFLGPAVPGDVLAITTELAKVTERSIVIAQRAVKGDDEKQVIKAEITVVFVDGRTGKPVPTAGIDGLHD